MDPTPGLPYLGAPPLRMLVDAITALEQAGGAGLPENWYETAADIRSITGYSDNDVVGLIAAGYLYQFDSASTVVDDGTTTLIPNNITHPAPGRWLRVVSFSLASHTHTDKLNVPSAQPSGELMVLNSVKELVATGKTINSFIEDAAYVHTDTNFTQTEKTKLAGLGATPDITVKMDKITPTVSNEGNIVLLDATGNANDSGVKPDDLIKISAEANKTISAFPGNVYFDIATTTAFDTAEIRTILIYGTNKVQLNIIADNAGNILQVTPSHYDVNDQLNAYTITGSLVSGSFRVTITIASGPGTITIKRPKTILL